MIRSEKGQSLLEFALVIPILLLLVCGIFDFGRFLYTYAHLHMSAQEAVRLGGLGKSDIIIKKFTYDYFHLGDDRDLTITITPTESNRRSGQYVTVNLEYNFSMITPVISSLFPDQIIEAKSTIRIE